MDNYRIKCIIFLILITTSLITSCGGSGGNNDDEEFKFESAVLLDTSISGKVKSETSDYFTLSVEEGVTYTSILTSLDGDADLAVRNSVPTTDIQNVIVYSVKNDALVDKIIFTASFTGIYYVEVNGFTDTKYSLITRKSTQEEVPIYFSEDKVVITSILPDLINIETQVEVSGPLLLILDDALVDKSVSWMTYDLKKLEANGQPKQSIEVNIRTPDKTLSTSIYKTKIRFTKQLNDPSVFIFKDLPIEYHVSTANIPKSTSTNSPLSINIYSPNDSPVSHQLAYGPAGMSMNNENLSFKNITPLFSKNTIFNFGIQTSINGKIIVSHGSVEVTDTTQNKPAFRTVWKLPSVITAGDFDDDDKNEIFIAIDKQIFTIKYNGSDYVQDWVYPFNFADGYTIKKSDAIDIDGDGFHEFILVAERNRTSKIFILDGKSREIINTFETGLGSINDYKSFDLDNDGFKEIILLGDSLYTTHKTIHTIDIKSGLIIWQSEPGKYGLKIEIGNTDADTELEIITESGHIIDTTTYSLNILIDKKIYSHKLHDLDNDGIDEIIYISDNGLNYFDVTTLLEINHPLIPSVSGIYIADIDNTPGKEILLRHTAPSRYSEYSYSTSSELLERKTSTPSTDHDLNNAIFFDVDNDGTKEIIKTIDTASTAPDILQIASGYPNIITEWVSNNPSEYIPPFLGGVKVSTASGEAKAAYLISSSSDQSTSPHGTRLLTWDINNKKLNISPAFSAPVTDILFSIMDYDNDYIDELIIGQNNPFNGNHIGIYNVETYQEILKIDLAPTQGDILAITREDINQDDYNDIIITSLYKETKFNGTGFDTINETNVWIYDVYNQSTIINFVYSTDKNFSNIYTKAVDLDDDGNTELIIAYTSNDLSEHIEILSLDKNGVVTDKYTKVLNAKFIDLLFLDIDQDNIKEIILLQGDFLARTSSILTLDQSLNILAQHDFKDNFRSIYPETIGSVNGKNILVSSTSSAFIGIKVSTVRENNHILSIDLLSGNEVWRSPSIIGSVERNSLSVHDISGNGDYKMFFATEAGIYATQ